MNEFFSWQSLSSFGTAVTATAVITQFLKEIGFLSVIPKRVLSLFVAIIICELSFLFTTPFSISEVVLQLFNGILVSLSANGSYDFITENKM